MFPVELRGSRRSPCCGAGDDENGPRDQERDGQDDEEAGDGMRLANERDSDRHTTDGEQERASNEDDEGGPDQRLEGSASSIIWSVRNRVRPSQDWHTPPPSVPKHPRVCSQDESASCRRDSVPRLARSASRYAQRGAHQNIARSRTPVCSR